MARSCLSASLRKTERMVTRHYDEHLAPSGISAVQLPILAIIAAAPDASFRLLAEQLDLDRSTLSRNLGLLERRGLLTLGPSSGPKPGLIELTAQGRAALRHAHECWTEAHATLEATLSQNTVADGLAFLKTLRRQLRNREES